MKTPSYKNHDFGTFTLHADKLVWVDGNGIEGNLVLTDVASVWPGQEFLWPY